MNWWSLALIGVGILIMGFAVKLKGGRQDG